MSKFITFEGIDGAGKSSHIEWLTDLLKSLGYEVICTREPGGTPLGEELRKLLLNNPMHMETEALLMFAARKEHIEQVIKPALEKGIWVISDRFTDSSFAFQGGGRDLDYQKLRTLENFVHPNFQPDLTLLFDLPVEVAQSRIQGRVLDKFEKENIDFHNKVRNMYLRRAAESQFDALVESRFRIQKIDATKDIPAIRADILKLLHDTVFNEI